MANLMSFVVNTGTREGDQFEIARYQQYYHAQGVALAAQPQPHGGFLLTTYHTQQPGGGDYADVAPAQYAPAAQYAPTQYAPAQYAPAQYAPAPQPAETAPAGYGPPPQPYAGAEVSGPAIAPQPLVAVQGAYGPVPEPPVFSTQHGFGTPQQYGGAAQGAYVSPPAPAGAARAGYGSPPQQPGGAVQGGAVQGGYGSPPQQPVQGGYGSPPQQYGGAAQAAYASPPVGPGPGAYGVPQQPAAQAWAPLPQDTSAAPAAYGQGFSSGAPGVAPGGAIPVPAARRTGLGNLGLLQKLKFAATGVVVLGLAGWSFFLMRQAQSNIVLFENSLDVPGELSLAGKSYGSISPRQALRLELDSGNYEVSFTGNGTKLDGGTLTVPKGSSTVGYRAVYNLGGKKGLAVVTKYYGGTFEDRVAAVAEGTRVVEVPGAQSLDRIDEGFPDTITVPKHASYGTVVRVCHVDEAKGTVGCPGW